VKNENDNCEGELVYFEGQIDRIINLDESEVPTNGTTKLSGGRPVTRLLSIDSTLPKGATASNKSGYSATFQTKSETQLGNQKANINFFQHVPSVKGVFGFGCVAEVGMEIGANPKAGMDTIDFATYLTTTIVPLYLNASDTKGKRDVIIVGNGPGRFNTVMLAELRLRGFYLILGVPNITHMTQATDRNYGPFKTKYRNNLSKLTDQRMKTNKTIQPENIPLLIFGDQDDTSVTLHNSFECAFGFDFNVKVWAKIGVKPFDRNYLQG